MLGLGSGQGLGATAGGLWMDSVPVTPGQVAALCWEKLQDHGQVPASTQQTPAGAAPGATNTTRPPKCQLYPVIALDVSPVQGTQRVCNSLETARPLKQK